jgi:phosphatidylserine/phosphatidylglycerophosphate/cardiolipin synthase-like enzyme
VLAGCGTVAALPDANVVRSALPYLAAGVVVEGASNLSLFVEPDATVQPILDAIARAKSSVQVEMYILSDDRIIQALINTANRGVKVQVMMEPAPFNPEQPNSPLPVNRITQQKFAGTKVQVGWTDPRFRFTHAKLLLIDNKEAFICTMNFSKSGSTVNREFGAIDKDQSDVNDLENIFNADWTHTPYTPTSSRLVISPDNAQPRLYGLLSKATKSLVVYDEILADPDTVALLGKRVKAGVDVKVILGAPDHTPINIQAAKDLKAVGVTVKYLEAPVVHAKMILADGAKAYIGSVNLSTNSLKNNREVGIIMTDSKLLNVLEGTFKNDWSHTQDFTDNPAPAPTAAPSKDSLANIYS